MEQSVSVQSSPEVHSNSGLAWRGLAQVFYSPSSFFAELKNNPKIVVPYLALAIVTFAVFYFMADVIIDLQLQSPQVQESLQLQGMDANSPQLRSAMRLQTMIAAPVVMMLAPLVAALLAWFFGNFVLGGACRFSQILSVMLYSEYLFMLGSLATVPLVLAQESHDFTISLAILVADQGPMSLAYQALSKISLFHIWEIIVAGIGLSTIYGFTRNKGYLLAVLSLGLMALLSVLGTAIGQML